MDPCAPQPHTTASYATNIIMLAACIGAGWLMHLATRSELAAALTMAAFAAAYLWPRGDSPACRAYRAARLAAQPQWLRDLALDAPPIPIRVPT